MSPGPARQQPPTYRAPAPAQSSASAGSNAPAPRQVLTPASQVSPRFGYATAGLAVVATTSSTAGRTSAGAQQFTPTAITASTSAAMANASESGWPARVTDP